MSALFWVVIAIVCGIIEVATLTLVVAPFALGALLAAGAAALGFPIAVQFGVLILTVAVFLLLVRKHLVNRMDTPHTRTGIALLEGASGRALQEVTSESGQVKIDGEVWSARSWFDEDQIDEGQKIEVVRIEGATAVVRPLYDSMSE